MFSLKKISDYDNGIIIKYYLFSIMRNLLLYLPVLVLFLEMTLNNSVKVGVVLLVKSLTVGIFELPMGYFSDMVSRKFSLNLSLVLNILSLLFFIFKPTFYTLIIAEFIFGISETLSSGSDIALVYDNFKYNKDLKLYDLYQRNEIFILSIVLALSFFTGSVLYELNQDLVFWIPIIAFLFSFLILIKIPEYPYKQHDFSNSNKSFVENLKYSIKMIKNSPRRLKIHICYGVCLNGIFTSVYMLLFPIVLNSYVSSNFIYGAVYAIAVVLIGVGAKAQSKVKPDKILILPILMAIVFLCNYLLNFSYVIVASLLLMRFLWGVFNSFFIIELNRLIEESFIRATYFSIYSSLINIFSGVIIFILSIILGILSSQRYIFLILSMFFLVIFIIQKVIFKLNRKH